MPTFPLGHNAYLTRIKNARVIAQAQPAQPEPAVTHRFEFPIPTDLRGIPVVGGVSGTSPGTDPLLALLAAEAQRERHAA